MKIETERLILRPWNEDDAASLYKHASDPRIGPAAGWPPHKSVEESRNIIRHVLSAPGTFAVVDRETGEAAGSVGIMVGGASNLGLNDDEAEIGYWIGAAYWGRGLMTEAVHAAMTHAFTALGMQRLWCGYYDGNEKSRRVQEKCGFTYRYTKENVPCPMLDETRTEHVTCITKTEWERES